MLRTGIVAALALFVATADAAEPAGPSLPASVRRREEGARRRSTMASGLYDQGRYDDALRLFLAAYDLAPPLTSCSTSVWREKRCWTSKGVFGTLGAT